MFPTFIVSDSASGCLLLGLFLSEVMFSPEVGT